MNAMKKLIVLLVLAVTVTACYPVKNLNNGRRCPVVR